jgi:hypothetical protein
MMTAVPQAGDVVACMQAGGNRQKQGHEGRCHGDVEASGIEDGPKAGHVVYRVVVAEDKHAPDIQREQGELAGDQRKGEGEDGPERQHHAPEPELLEEPVLSQHADEQGDVDQYPDEPGYHIADGEEGDICVQCDQQEDDDEPQAGRQQILPDEDGPWLAEHSEQRDEYLVEGLDRCDQYQDEDQPYRRLTVDRRPHQSVAEDEERADRRRAGSSDSAERHEDGAEHPVVVALLLVLGEEATEQLALPQTEQDPCRGGEGQGVGERAEVRLRQCAHDDDLRRETDEHGRDAPHHEERGPTYLPTAHCRGLSGVDLLAAGGRG